MVLFNKILTYKSFAGLQINFVGIKREQALCEGGVSLSIFALSQKPRSSKVPSYNCGSQKKL